MIVELCLGASVVDVTHSLPKSSSVCVCVCGTDIDTFPDCQRERPLVIVLSTHSGITAENHLKNTPVLQLHR